MAKKKTSKKSDSNITCPKCRYRHPKNLTCEQAKQRAEKSKEQVKEPQVREPNPWATLKELIEAYRDAAIAESWKGGGDPMDFEVIEARYQFTEIQLHTHLSKMIREFDPD